MSKKKHYEYNENRNYDYKDRDKARTHRMKPNDRWRYNPKEHHHREGLDDEYSEEQY